MNVSTIAGILFSLATTAYVIQKSRGKGETDLEDENETKVATETA